MSALRQVRAACHGDVELVMRPRIRPRERHGVRSLQIGFRQGITLLEVLIALAIFLGAFTVISQIMRTGAQASNQSQQENEIVLRAKSLMNEVLAGSIEMNPVDQASFDDTDLYVWSLSVSDGPVPDLFLVEVTVSRRRPNGTIDMPFTLSRYMRDPEVFLQTTVDSPSLF